MKRLFVAVIALVGILLVITFVSRRTRNQSSENVSTAESSSPRQPVGEQAGTNGFGTRWQSARAVHSAETEQPAIWYERLSEGAPSPFPNEEALQQYLAGEESARQKALQADIAAGLNEAIRNRESQLRSQSTKLKTGLPMSEVLKALGSPNGIHARIQSASMVGREPVKEMEKLEMDREIYLTYSPDPEDIFDELNGVAHQELTVLFTTNRTVGRWTWETPIPRVSLSRSFYNHLLRMSNTNGTNRK